MGETVVVLDIDQTLAGGVVPAHMGLYNERLGLGMRVGQIAETEKYKKTFDVPQVIGFRGQGEKAEKRFQEVRAEIRTSHGVHLAFNELPFSVEGARRLLSDVQDPEEQRLVFGGYYTVRPNELEATTQEWLAQRKFPFPEHVVICKDHADKLGRIFQDYMQPRTQEEGKTANTPTTVVLVDDSIKELAEAAKRMVAENPDMKGFMERLVLVGFGQMESQTAEVEGTFYPATGLRTLALPSWESQHVSHLRKTLKEF